MDLLLLAGSHAKADFRIQPNFDDWQSWMEVMMSRQGVLIHQPNACLKELRT